MSNFSFSWWCWPFSNLTPEEKRKGVKNEDIMKGYIPEEKALELERRCIDVWNQDHSEAVNISQPAFNTYLNLQSIGPC